MADFDNYKPGKLEPLTLTVSEILHCRRESRLIIHIKKKFQFFIVCAWYIYIYTAQMYRPLYD